jgi:hypothetical protein
MADKKPDPVALLYKLRQVRGCKENLSVVAYQGDLRVWGNSYVSDSSKVFLDAALKEMWEPLAKRAEELRAAEQKRLENEVLTATVDEVKSN